MIRCPNCLNLEMSGAIFCGECGVQLVFPDGIPTSSIKKTGSMGGKSETVSSVEAGAGTQLEHDFEIPASAGDATLMLYLLGTGDKLPIYTSDDVILGRISEGQPVMPDIDLTPYKGYEAGVSRMHASIRSLDEKLTLTDLGSANGTRINGRQITSHIPYPIKHGDILTLGKFKIQILVRS